MSRPLFIITLVAMIPATRIVTLLAHELSHAIVAVLLTRTKISVVLGSHENPGSSPTIATRWVDIFLTGNPLRWRSGYCIPGLSRISPGKQILIILAGPVIPLAAASAMLYAALELKLHTALLLFSLLFTGWTLLIFVLSLFPRKYPVKMHGRDVLYSDGLIIISILRVWSHFEEMTDVTTLYFAGHYSEAATKAEALVRRYPKDRDLSRIAISACWMADHLQEAYDINRLYEERFTMEVSDLITAASIKARLEYYEESLEDFDRALLLDEDNILVWLNRGYSLNCFNRHSEAIDDFNTAIEIDPTCAYAYANRGLARLRLGMIEDGLSDVRHSLELNENEAYGHRNLGIYHLERGEIAEALELFTKARELDPYTHLVNNYLEQAKAGLPSYSSS